MSWDVFLFRTDYGSMEEMPRDYRPDPLGPRDGLREAVARLFPALDARDPSWWQLSTAEWSIELNVGKAEEVDSIMLHVRGSEAVLPAVQRICEALGTKAFDCGTGEFLDFAGDPGHGLRGWQDLLARATRGK